ncbi:site-specific integrase [Paraburkholderia sp. JPY432]|uniref:gamma-mobile-trio recombinase GmtY n=1 Tax=Paraburkholderia youngii TaxID=2782701 RepID=UPI00159505A7|nr:gamma-mobile-trio recombinase GmtY [Paraburkholderia youngii]NVH73724.1 site-specific integrase [Paraburkholderia youngii]
MGVPLVLVRGRVFFDSTGIPTEIPVLLTPDGVVYQLLDYFLLRQDEKSNSWMRKVGRAVILLLEYKFANPTMPLDQRFFTMFAKRLGTGSIDPLSGEDLSGLGWTALSPTEKRHVIQRLTNFFEHVAATSPEAAKLNPLVTASAFEQGLQDVAYQHMRFSAFLGHTWQTAEERHTSTMPMVRGERPAKVEKRQPARFPDQHLMNLLMEGFKTRIGLNYRDILITLLLNGGGVRVSEPFHLFPSDVMPNPYRPEQALVLIHHPIEGGVPDDWVDSRGRPRRGNRGQYLRERWGIIPRKQMLGGKEAGWKGGTHEAQGAARFHKVHWFVPEFGEMFLYFWYLYLEQLISIERNHPFAFVNLWREPKGAMYSINKFRASHDAAVHRIGLNVSKAEGTTPHGHRHAYGKRAKKARLDVDLRRRMMHHTSLESMDVYTAPTEQEIEEALAQGVFNLEGGLELARSIRSAMS